MKINISFKKIVLSVLIGCCFPAFAQIEINDEAGLKGISANLAGSYKLTADIVLTENWTPLGEFTGTLDGNGHIISGLKFSTSSNVQGFISKTNGAIISKLGFENAHITGGTQVGVIVGDVYGGSISECYVANSSVTGKEHLGAIAGRINRNAVIENCYASAVVKGEKQSGGVIGVLRNSKVSKCYFSGTVSTNSRRANGIVGLVDPNESGQTGEKTIEYCVNLAPYLFVADGDAYGYSDKYHFRIVDGGSNSPVLTSNYSLASGKLGKSLTDCRVVDTAKEQYGADKYHGANLAADSDAKSETFYHGTLGWDFAETWQLLSGGYPVLKWQVAPVNSFMINRDAAYSLSGSETIDLKKLISSHGLNLTFTPKSSKIKIEDGVVSINGQVMMLEDVVIEISGGAGYKIDDIVISLLPSGPIQLSTSEDLLLINIAPSLTFELANDIDLTGVAFSGLCTDANPFTGVFDGKGHVITGLSIDNAGENAVGFFRKAQGAVIRKVGFENARITGKNQAAVIVGDVYGGSISECYVANSTVTGNEHLGAVAGRINRNAVVENCYATAIVTGEKQSGGVVGVLRNSKVSKCYFSGIVSTGTRRANGIVGLVDPDESGQTGAKTIEYCVNLAPYLLVADGDAYGYSDSYHFRVVDGGSNNPVLTSNYSLGASKLGKSLADGKVVSTSKAQYGADKYHGANLPADSDAKSETFYNGTLGWDFSDTWKMLDDGYPVLKWQQPPVKFSVLKNLDSYTLVKGTPVSIADLVLSHGLDITFTSKNTKIKIEGNQISLDADIQESENAVINIVATNNFKCLDSINVKLLSGSGVLNISTPEDLVDASLYPGLSFILKNDIDMTGVVFTPIGTASRPFTGTFDGDGHVIRNLKIDNSSADNVGLFGYVGAGTIKNLGIEDAQIVGNKDVGTFAGVIKGGTVENSYVSGSYVEGRANAGGIAGTVSDNGIIKNSFSSADVNAHETNAGGIAGTIYNGHIESCYASGRITARDRSGGIAALLDVNGTDASLNSIKNCLNLSPELTGATQYPQRIIWTFGRAMTLLNNYSLAATQLAKGSEKYQIDASESYYGAANLDGANIPGGDQQAKANPFYSTGINWDFNQVWTFDRNFDYPILRLFSTDPEFRDGGTGMCSEMFIQTEVYVSGNMLFIQQLPANSVVSIYTITGGLLSNRSISANFSFALPANGLYMVVVENEGQSAAYKIVSK